MDGLEKLDSTHAIFSGFGSIWQRIMLFCACGIFGQFVGGNIYEAPKLIDNVRLNGLAAIGDLRPMNLAWLPVEWLGVLVISAMHLTTALYLPVLLFAFLKLVRDDIAPWMLAVVLIGQPIDAWLVRQSWESSQGGDSFLISFSLLVVYTGLVVGGFYWWWHLREDHEA